MLLCDECSGPLQLETMAAAANTSVWDDRKRLDDWTQMGSGGGIFDDIGWFCGTLTSSDWTLNALVFIVLPFCLPSLYVSTSGH